MKKQKKHSQLKSREFFQRTIEKDTFSLTNTEFKKEIEY